MIVQELMKLGEQWGLLIRRRRELVKTEKNCGNNSKKWLVGADSNYVHDMSFHIKNANLSMHADNYQMYVMVRSTT